MPGASIKIQPCTAADYSSVRRLVDASESLDKHTDYTYWIALNQWPHLFLVAKLEDQVVGFTFGFRNANNPGRLFLWQIGVSVAKRRQGIAERLVLEFCERGKRDGAKELWTTIADDITPSLSLFKKIAATYGANLVERGSTGDLGGLLQPEQIYSIVLA